MEKTAALKKQDYVTPEMEVISVEHCDIFATSDEIEKDYVGKKEMFG